MKSMKGVDMSGGCPEFRADLQRILGKAIPSFDELKARYRNHPTSFKPRDVAFADNYDVKGKSEAVKDIVRFLKAGHVKYANMAQSEGANINYERLLEVAKFICENGMATVPQVAHIKGVAGMHVQNGRHTTTALVLMYGFDIDIPALFVEEAKLVSLNDNSTKAHRKQGMGENSLTNTTCVMRDADKSRKDWREQLQRALIANHNEDDEAKRNLMLSVINDWKRIEDVALEVGLRRVHLDCQVLGDGSTSKDGVTCKTLAAFLGPLTNLKNVPAPLKWIVFRRMFYDNAVPFFNAYVRQIMYFMREAKDYVARMSGHKECRETLKRANAFLEEYKILLGQNLLTGMGMIAYQMMYEARWNVEIPERMRIDEKTIESLGKMFAKAAADWLASDGNPRGARPLQMRAIFAGRLMKTSKDKLMQVRGGAIIAECNLKLTSKVESEVETLLKRKMIIDWISDDVRVVKMWAKHGQVKRAA